LQLQPTGSGYQPGEVRDVPPLDLVVIVETPDGAFTARPFADENRGERSLGRWRSTWRTFATLENKAGESRGIVQATLEARCDGVAVVELLLANAIQVYSTEAKRAGDFCYREVRIETSSRIVLPLPRAGEVVTMAEDGSSSLRLVTDGRPHLWPRMTGALRRIVLLPPGSDPVHVARAEEVGRFFGCAFAIEGANSWIEAAAHGPERGLLAPWTDSLDVWGPKGPAGARALLDGMIGGILGPRTSGAAGNAFTGPALGLFHGIGQPQEGEPGGWKIRPVGSFALDRRLLLERWLEIEHGLDRSRILHFEPRSGRPTTALGWAAKFGGRVPFPWKNHGDGRFPWLAFARNPSTGGLVRVSNVTQGRMVEHGDGALLFFDPQDDQHEIRDEEPVETFVRFTGSGIGLVLLELLAASAELARHDLQSPAGDVTLSKLLADAAARPRQGSTNAGRALAWDLRSIAGYWEVAPPRWRELRRSWANSLARWALVARSSAGLLMRDPDGGHSTEVALEQGAPAGFSYVQTFEEAYLTFSLEQLAAVAMPGNVSDRDLRDVLVGIGDAVEALWSVRDPANGLVPKFVGTRSLGGPEFASRSAVSPTVEATWVWGAIATAARCAARAGDPSAFEARRALLLRAGRPSSAPSPTFEQYVRAAQALEREPWHGSVDYSLLAWGEAWRARGASAPVV
jgi:hypothetical protein